MKKLWNKKLIAVSRSQCQQAAESAFKTWASSSRSRGQPEYTPGDHTAALSGSAATGNNPACLHGMLHLCTEYVAPRLILIPAVTLVSKHVITIAETTTLTLRTVKQFCALETKPAPSPSPEDSRLLFLTPSLLAQVCLS